MVFRRIIFSLLAVFFLLSSVTQAGAANEFKKNNPDVDKYAFAQSYISALGYLNAIGLRRQKTSFKKRFSSSDVALMRGYVSFLIKDNLELRIAKNYLSKYLDSPNSLIRKTADIFIAACVMVIAVNEKEKVIWDQWYAIKSNKFDTRVNEQAFIKAQRELSLKRKNVYKDIIESSILLTKVLRSDHNADEKGTLLAVTVKERKALLAHLDEYGKKMIDWGLNPGQDHVHASIAVIRELLEDPIYTCIHE